MGKLHLVIISIFVGIAFIGCKPYRENTKMESVSGMWEQVKLSHKDSTTIRYSFESEGVVIKSIESRIFNYIDTAEYSITEQWYSYYLNIYGFKELHGYADPSGKYKILKMNNEVFILQRIETWQLDRNHSYPFLRMELFKI